MHSLDVMRKLNQAAYDKYVKPGIEIRQAPVDSLDAIYADSEDEAPEEEPILYPVPMVARSDWAYADSIFTALGRLKALNEIPESTAKTLQYLDRRIWELVKALDA